MGMPVDSSSVPEGRREFCGTPQKNFHCPTCKKETQHIKKYGPAGPATDLWVCLVCAFANTSV